MGLPVTWVNAGPGCRTREGWVGGGGMMWQSADARLWVAWTGTGVSSCGRLPQSSVCARTCVCACVCTLERSCVFPLLLLGSRRLVHPFPQFSISQTPVCIASPGDLAKVQITIQHPPGRGLKFCTSRKPLGVGVPICAWSPQVLSPPELPAESREPFLLCQGLWGSPCLPVSARIQGDSSFLTIFC